MAINLLPLCELPKLAMRDGYAGRNAHILYPFYGYWYADGKILTFPDSQVAQNTALTVTGEYKTLPFHKAAGFCVAPAPAIP